MSVDLAKFRSLLRHSKFKLVNQGSILKSLKETEKELKDKFQILRIGIFGSYSKGTQTEESDIDLIYELEENAKIGFKEINDLEQFFKDLFKIEKIDLVNSKYVNPIVEEEIKKSVIYV